MGDKLNVWVWYSWRSLPKLWNLWPLGHRLHFYLYQKGECFRYISPQIPLRLACIRWIKDMLHWYQLWLTSFYVTTFDISLMGFDTVYNVFKWIIIKPLTYLSIWNIYNMLSQEVSPCDSSPCPNNMTCVRDGANYTCQCMAGFTGLNCENGKVINWTRQYTTLHIQTTKLSSIIDALKSCKHYDPRIALL